MMKKFKNYFENLKFTEYKILNFFNLIFNFEVTKKGVGHEWPMLLSSWVQRRE